ncbi:hypothetical protein KEM48_009773 [Puccinia striiformis f. sp. tritici PST-130]|nr:hypothetical protein KEM48_009773 [Puccinia striiformis f. sp. tritici PST-130]
MDLYNTLIARDWTLAFLHEMGQHYRGIAIYTSSSEAYATEIARQIAMRYKEAYPDSKYILSIKSCPVRIAALLMKGGARNYESLDPWRMLCLLTTTRIRRRWSHGHRSPAPLSSSVDSVSDSLHKLKNVWYNVGLVNVVPSTIGVTC